MPTSLTNPWTIDLTSNDTGYPQGSKVKILLNPNGSYTMKWRMADGREAMLTPLELSQNGTLLSNDFADGFIEETKQGVYDVDILVQTALQRLSGSAILRGAVATPGQLVGQWGAESTGTMGEEKPKKDKDAKPGERPAAAR